ncbi:murein biosynthesis integral membrane protein MurJ [Candidatus Nomurabacteria bacterium]|uniref:Probable lipid II flippase MurJ n=1 Tax=candidate division WWE3 bacterium TaxID=2053526 RepID=A0A955DZ15_UNCKA|nr:murein biosynthesis integral membrane protein MurJ [candidate division WWE3 bacterium]MCB9823812.1 murein biosynthesis integral membrane protein MurJ [Candidatus Nomurabacteria bacterium]MCB9826782.1 murein biosynthesis integral membrane protein MurJ [Candidatus Nomurabacteria bacterium]MCB9827607.1 murein biosynthesis integral membrane protein MurJ [Candidatus Nomurabacteria bacterium]HXK52605.1 murein biosynthesis integral membrane protein MurJ [bacterium]
MKKFYKNITNKIKIRGRWSFIAKAQKTILSAAFVIALFAGLSSILGFVKGRMLINFFGVSDELGIFYAADRVPNMVYSIIVAGAISTIFIPVFTDLLKKDKKEAWKTASNVINITLISFLFLGGFLVIFAYPVMNLLSLGELTPEQLKLGAGLMRIMVGSQLILILSSLLSSILQSHKFFLVPAAAPVLYNVGMIVGLIALSGKYGIYAPALGTVVGAALHLLIQIPLLKKTSFSYVVSKTLLNKETRKIFSLVPPRIASVVLTQLSIVVNNSLAILISPASVVILKSASQVQFLPVNIFGASMALASLPVLAEHADTSEHDKFKRIFITTLHQTAYLVLPFSALMLVLRVPIVRIVYGVANFPWEATIETALTLGFFSLSIFSQSVVYLFTRAFYALKDTTTPVTVSLLTIIINTTLSVFFVHFLRLGVWSLAMSYTITSLLDSILLFYKLDRKLNGFILSEVLVPLIKISTASAMMGVFVYVPMKILDLYVLDTSRTIQLIITTGTSAASGLGIYLLLTKLLKVEEVNLFYKLILKIKPKKTFQEVVSEEQ